MTHTDLAPGTARDVLEWLRVELGLATEDVARLVGVDAAAVVDWIAGRSVPSPEHRRRLEPFEQLRQLVGASFRSAEAAHGWMRTPVPGLGGRTPRSALAAGDVDEVVALLGGLRAGAFR